MHACPMQRQRRRRKLPCFGTPEPTAAFIFGLVVYDRLIRLHHECFILMFLFCLCMFVYLICALCTFVIIVTCLLFCRVCACVLFCLFCMLRCLVLFVCLDAWLFWRSNVLCWCVFVFGIWFVLSLCLCWVCIRLISLSLFLCVWVSCVFDL